MSLLYDRVITIVNKAPSERSEHDVMNILPWFCRMSELFRSLRREVVADIIYNCEFTTCQTDDVIIKQAEKGHSFFLILRGTVSIYIKQVISDEEDETKMVEHSRQSEVYADGGQLDRKKLGNFITTLGAGKTFGELALINKNCIRNASIIVDETTDLLVVNRELYNRCLRAAQTAEMKDKTNFVNEHILFKHWASKYKKQLIYSLQKESIYYGCTIVRQGEAASALYFLIKGQANLLMDPSQYANQFPLLHPLDNPDKIETRQIWTNGKLPTKIRKNRHASIGQKSALHGLALKKRKLKRMVEVREVGPTEIIGDTEFILELRSYLQTVRCTTICDVYRLNQRNYERLVVKRNNKTVHAIREQAQMKLDCRIAWLPQNQTPFLKTLSIKMQSMTDLIMQQERRRKEGKTAVSGTDPSDDVLPSRGLLINLSGPGSVYYRNQMRGRDGRDKMALHQGISNRLKPAGNSWNHGGYDHRYGQPTSRDESEADSLSRHASLTEDFELSDRELSVLERRIQCWHSRVTGLPDRKPRIRTSIRLPRLALKSGKELKSGRRVIVKKPMWNSLLPTREGDRLVNITSGPVVSGSGKNQTEQQRLNDMCYDRHSSHFELPERLPRRESRSYTVEDYKKLKKLLEHQQRSMPTQLTL